MKYIIDEEEVFNSAGDAARYIIDNLDESYYDDMLNEIYGEIDVCGYSYDAANLLREVDEIAYRCGMGDYYDSLGADLEYEIDRMDEGDEEEFYGVTVKVEDDEVEEDDEEDEEEE